jgi:RNA polymerase II subunit A small phosphatase-like protein
MNFCNEMLSSERKPLGKLGALLPLQNAANRGRKTLVLDLDETLVHSSFQPVDNVDIVLPVEIEGEVFYIYAVKRPGVEIFLNRMKKSFEIVIFTASLSLYADPLLDEIDSNKTATYRLFREHCTFYKNSFVKDLSLLGRNLKDVIIVDNSPASYLFQPGNAIPISTWIDDISDSALHELSPLLEFLAEVNDVRPYLKRIIENGKINYNHVLRLMQENKQNIEQLDSVSEPIIREAQTPRPKSK